MNPSTGGWRNPSCYFVATARRVLEAYFAKEGFEPREVDNDAALQFRRFGLFVDISYNGDRPHPYPLELAIGKGESKYNIVGGVAEAVPFWYVIPANHSAREYAQWGFSSESELEILLIRIQNEVLDVFGKALWQRTELLDNSIRNFRAEFA